MTMFGSFAPGMLGYIGLFVGALLVYEGTWQFITRADVQAAARNRRMKMIARGASNEDVLKVMNTSGEIWWLRGIPLLNNLPRDLRQAGITTKPLSIVSICVGGAVLTVLTVSYALPPSFAGMIAISLWIAFPLALLQYARKGRVDAFSRQLPEALDLMGRGLRVGHPLNVTIDSVAKEMGDPIASEFGVIVDQVTFGDTLVDAVFDLSKRMPTEDVEYLASAIAIQSGTGGDLARVLSVLSTVIRGRNALRRKVKAISAEGRLSGMFLSAVPVIMTGAMSIITPSYYGAVAGDSLFMPCVLTVIFLVLLNAFIMWRLVNFRV